MVSKVVERIMPEIHVEGITNKMGKYTENGT